MYDFFVSHASLDKEIIVDALVENLQNMGYKVWYDKNDILAGDNIPNEIKKGLSNSYCCLLILSHNFMHSKWTFFEIGQFSNTYQGRIIPLIYHLSENEKKYIQDLIGNLKYIDIESISKEDLASSLSRTLVKVKEENYEKLVIDNIEEIQKKLATYETQDPNFLSIYLHEYLDFLNNHKDFIIYSAKKIVLEVLRILLEKKGYKNKYQNEDTETLLKLMDRYHISNLNIREQIEFVLKLEIEKNSEEYIRVLNRTILNILQYYTQTQCLIEPAFSRIEIALPEDLTYNDFIDMYRIDQKVMRKDLIADIDTTYGWYVYNKYTHIAVRETISHRVIGYFSVLPITDDTYVKIINGDFQDKDFTEDALEQYIFSDFYKIYVAAVGIDPEYQNTGAFIILYNALIDMFISLAQDREIYISEVLAEASTKQGEKFCKMVGMKKISHTSNDTDIYELVMIPPEFRLRNHKGKELYTLYSQKFEEYKDYFKT